MERAEDPYEEVVTYLMVNMKRHSLKMELEMSSRKSSLSLEMSFSFVQALDITDCAVGALPVMSDILLSILESQLHFDDCHYEVYLVF